MLHTQTRTLTDGGRTRTEMGKDVNRASRDDIPINLTKVLSLAHWLVFRIRIRVIFFDIHQVNQKI